MKTINSRTLVTLVALFISGFFVHSIRADNFINKVIKKTEHVVKETRDVVVAPIKGTKVAKAG